MTSPLLAKLWTPRGRGRRRPLRARLALGVVCLVASTGIAPAARAADGLPDTLRLATGSVGGTFLPVGHDLAGWWMDRIPGLVVLPDTTAGSVDNLERLASGRAQLAIVGYSPFREVLTGWDALSKKVRSVCTVGTLYEDAEQFVVRSSLVRAGNLLDLTGLVMYPGRHQSGAEADTRRILYVLQIEPRFVEAEHRDKGYAEAADALARGEFDAATFSGGVPIEAVSDLFQAHPGEFRILPFSRHMLNKLRHRDPDYQAVVIRKGSYAGMTEDVPTVGGPNLLVASPGLDPFLLARLEAAIQEGIAVPGKGLRGFAKHPVLQSLDLALWSQTPGGRRCAQGTAELGGAGGADASPR